MTAAFVVTPSAGLDSGIAIGDGDSGPGHKALVYGASMRTRLAKNSPPMVSN